MHLFRYLCAVCLVLTPVLVWAQSPLGDAARQEQERRKTIKAAGRVYTNKDLPNVPPATSPAPAPATDAANPDPTTETKPAEASADAATPAAETAEETPKDRAYWGARMAALRETLGRNQTLAEALQSRINALTTDFANRDDPFQRAAIGADRDRAVTELERLRKQLVADEQAINDLQDEARRAGVPAGWLR